MVASLLEIQARKISLELNRTERSYFIDLNSSFYKNPYGNSLDTLAMIVAWAQTCQELTIQLQTTHKDKVLVKLVTALAQDAQARLAMMTTEHSLAIEILGQIKACFNRKNALTRKTDTIADDLIFGELTLQKFVKEADIFVAQLNRLVARGDYPLNGETLIGKIILLIAELDVRLALVETTNE